jgi:hypothetical protein
VLEPPPVLEAPLALEPAIDRAVLPLVLVEAPELVEVSVIPVEEPVELDP